MPSSLPSLSSLPLQIPIHNHFSMPEFACSNTGTSDGDLQSVVRGFTNGISTTVMDYPQTCFSPLIIQQDDSVFSASFPELFETNTIFDELEELYKPFYPILNDPFSPQTVLSSSSISGSGEERESERVQEKEAFSGSPAAANSSALRVKYKRRKTQHKRVVLEVAAESVSSDVWAWRKYGQKPIKGSPYPRSYYRCSSLKGCLARKQVERSQLDPQMFIITYTAEHCHGQPTRKSSLAGTTRHKFSLPKNPTASDPDAPISPSSAAIKEDEIVERGTKKQSKQEEEEEVDDVRENNGLAMCDMVFCDDDFLLGFEELDRLIQC